MKPITRDFICYCPRKPKCWKIRGTKRPWRPGTLAQPSKRICVVKRGQWNIPLLEQFLSLKFIPVRDTSGDTVVSVAYNSNTQSWQEEWSWPCYYSNKLMLLGKWSHSHFKWLFQFTERQRESTDSSGLPHGEMISESKENKHKRWEESLTELKTARKPAPLGAVRKHICTKPLGRWP